MAKMKDVVKGAALGTVLGSIAVALYPKRHELLEAFLDQTHGLGDRAKDYAQVFFGEEHNHDMRNHYLTGGLAGLVLGAGMTLFLTPKTGKQLRAQVTKAYNILSDRRMNSINQILKAYQKATRHAPYQHHSHTRKTSRKGSSASSHRRK